MCKEKWHRWCQRKCKSVETRDSGRHQSSRAESDDDDAFMSPPRPLPVTSFHEKATVPSDMHLKPSIISGDGALLAPPSYRPEVEDDAIENPPISSTPVDKEESENVQDPLSAQASSGRGDELKVHPKSQGQMSSIFGASTQRTVKKPDIGMSSIAGNFANKVKKIEYQPFGGAFFPSKNLPIKPATKGMLISYTVPPTVLQGTKKFGNIIVENVSDGNREMHTVDNSTFDGTPPPMSNVAEMKMNTPSSPPVIAEVNSESSNALADVTLEQEPPATTKEMVVARHNDRATLVGKVSPSLAELCPASSREKTCYLVGCTKTVICPRYVESSGNGRHPQILKCVNVVQCVDGIEKCDNGFHISIVCGECMDLYSGGDKRGCLRHKQTERKRARKPRANFVGCVSHLHCGKGGNMSMDLWMARLEVNKLYVAPNDDDYTGTD